MILFYCWLYLAILLFLAGCVARAVRYARQPLHLRWEIYPVPHGRAGELKVMVPEILFLKGLWEFNRPMWCVSYPFHLGLYLLSAGVLLLGCSAAAPAAWVVAVHRTAAVCGTAGAVLTVAGSLGLMARRLSVRGLRQYSSAGDFLNLAWFAAAGALLLAGVWRRPAGSPGPLAILRGAAAFDTSLQVPPVLAAGIVAGAGLLAYIPMTHMAHFIAKYFTYHQVRWDERANVAGGNIGKRMAEYLMYRPTWQAPHIAAGGAEGGRTWAEIATSRPGFGKGGPR